MSYKSFNKTKDFLRILWMHTSIVLMSSMTSLSTSYKKMKTTGCKIFKKHKTHPSSPKLRNSFQTSSKVKELWSRRCCNYKINTHVSQKKKPVTRCENCHLGANKSLQLTSTLSGRHSTLSNKIPTHPSSQ